MREITPPFAVEEMAIIGLPPLEREAPQLVPRLATVLYWTTLSQGQPEDVPRYQRVFGSPNHLQRLTQVGIFSMR